MNVISFDPDLQIETHSESLPPDERFVLRRVYYVLDNILDVHPMCVGGKPKIEKCAAEIWQRAQEFSQVYSHALTRESQLFNFASKVGIIYNRARMFGVDKGDVAKSLIRDPSLFYKASDRMTERYWGHADRMSQFGVMPNQFAQLTVEWPNIYSYPEDTLQNRFLLCLAVSETPLFKLKGIDHLTFEQRRDYILFKRPIAMANAQDNYLMRLFHAELNASSDKPSTAIVRGPRLRFERAIVETLGHNPDKPCINVHCPLKGLARLPKIKGMLSQFVDALTSDIQRHPTDDTARKNQSITKVLLPEKRLSRTKSQKLMLSRILALNLLKNYKAVP